MRTHKPVAGPTRHRQVVGTKATDKFDLTCSCGERLTASTPNDLLARWKVHRRTAEEAV